MFISCSLFLVLLAVAALLGLAAYWVSRSPWVAIAVAAITLVLEFGGFLVYTFYLRQH